jgi:hypothetical protein
MANKFEVSGLDQVEFAGDTYTRWILDGGVLEYGLLERDGRWWTYAREWFQEASLAPYTGNVRFDDGDIYLDLW